MSLWDNMKINIETLGIKSRGWAVFVVRLGGIALLLLGTAILFFGGVDGMYALHRDVVYTVVDTTWILADFVAMGVGAAIANFV